MSAQFNLPGPELPVVDETRLLAEFGGDQTILTELRDLFMEHVPPQFEEIVQAIADGNAEEIAKQTHSLKGACATYGAPRLAMICKDAELAARAGDIEIIREHLDELRQEYEKVCQAIGNIGVPA